MKAAGAAGAILAALLLANVVGAGVIAVLGPLALELEDDAARVAGMGAAGILAVACAALFLHGAIDTMRRAMGG